MSYIPLTNMPLSILFQIFMGELVNSEMSVPLRVLQVYFVTN
jgi:hypothetical protein